ncbi:MAG TPA: hypothetical protein PLX89_07680 [Verrucomicrobiota bacterium]|nr:hypothetical protein [Verrucomicrobiales bacterium]HRI12869.1 hypothetical protein [Verrucomicrobiota bacterium]
MKTKHALKTPEITVELEVVQHEEVVVLSIRYVSCPEPLSDETLQNQIWPWVLQSAGPHLGELRPIVYRNLTTGARGVFSNGSIVPIVPIL